MFGAEGSLSKIWAEMIYADDYVIEEYSQNGKRLIIVKYNDLEFCPNIKRHPFTLKYKRNIDIKKISKWADAVIGYKPFKKCKVCGSKEFYTEVLDNWENHSCANCKIYSFQIENRSLYQETVEYKNYGISDNGAGQIEIFDYNSTINNERKIVVGYDTIKSFKGNRKINMQNLMSKIDKIELLF